MNILTGWDREPNAHLFFAVAICFGVAYITDVDRGDQALLDPCGHLGWLSERHLQLIPRVAPYAAQYAEWEARVDAIELKMKAKEDWLMASAMLALSDTAADNSDYDERRESLQDRVTDQMTGSDEEREYLAITDSFDKAVAKIEIECRGTTKVE